MRVHELEKLQISTQLLPLPRQAVPLLEELSSGYACLGLPEVLKPRVWLAGWGFLCLEDSRTSRQSVLDGGMVE